MLPATCEKQNMAPPPHLLLFEENLWASGFENLFELFVLLHLNSTASMEYHRWDDAENVYGCHDGARVTEAPQSTLDSKYLHWAATVWFDQYDNTYNK